MSLGLDAAMIDEIFSFHPPKNDDVARAHELMRETMKRAAHLVKENTPDSPEQTLAIRALQQAMMYSNAAIAIHS